jgi:hypothetical protein
MSEETPSPETPAPKVRRISNPRPKKTAKTASKKAAAESPVESPAEVLKEPVASSTPVEISNPSPAPEPVENSSAPSEWPEAETVSSASEGGSSEGKRKRRRKKKGNKNHNAAAADEGGAQQPQPAQPQAQSPRPAHQPQSQQHPQQQPRTQVDPTTLAKRAWKIFLAEVSEEGVSLISDHDARELSKRCFRLAELFLEEESRRVR